MTAQCHDLWPSEAVNKQCPVFIFNLPAQEGIHKAKSSVPFKVFFFKLNFAKEKLPAKSVEQGLKI